eukprot:CAMPEP_0180380470 /NCGR_PEP_ID=MMETSP0989-20121125/26043_1 /TAXON_ID=697907 /ORGANISM="non described non described, Strain CCMP2293" /LENGTH=56 /DNA_ID=CAMNT_0022379909 /DNA_START=26 /DNA_END=193 /DNA_ORIENTATION=-
MRGRGRVLSEEDSSREEERSRGGVRECDKDLRVGGGVRINPEMLVGTADTGYSSGT